MSGSCPRRWLLLIYRLPTDPSSARSAVWSETRRLGALSLQHGVCLLPRSDTTLVAYVRLEERIVSYAGEAMVLDTISPHEVWEAKILAQLNAARDEEYEEVVDETERFREEVAQERRKGKFKFAELEDEESNLERLRKYLEQVEARDTFGVVGRERARAEVECCADVLQEFAQEIYELQEALGNHRA